MEETPFPHTTVVQTQLDLSIGQPAKVVDQKFIVFKWDEFFALIGELALPPYWRNPGSEEAQADEPAGSDWDCAVICDYIDRRVKEVALEDAVVIRLQDAFAPAALDAYANNILAVMEAAKAAGNEKILEQLAPIADYFHQRASEAWLKERKLPD